MKTWTIELAAAMTLCAWGCGDATTPAEPEGGGAGGKADVVGDSDLYRALEGRGDVVADFLRANADDQGIVPGNYRDVVAGVADEMGCDLISQRTFVILLTRANFFPRNIMTLCSEDPVKASQFFLSTQSDLDLNDVDPRDIKMVAWDSKARTYRRYEMKPLAGSEGGMKLEIDPGQCRSCHTGPASLDNSQMPFIPIMNELVNPWTLWNAEPDFRSHQFEDTLNPLVKDGPYYKEMTEAGIMDSASNFEKHSRAAMDRVTNARLRTRRNPANLDQSLALLRPLFCDETLNYVSENHFTGETHASVAIDDSIRRLFLSIRPDNWPWDWLNDGVLRLSLPDVDEDPLAVMPVRGEATIQVEVSMVKRRVLSAQQVLRVRALDWKRPVFSELRCDLYKKAEARLLATPPDIGQYKRNLDLIPTLYNEIMKVEVFDDLTGQTRTVPLAPTGQGAELIAIEDAQDLEADYALRTSGDFSAFEVNLDGFGEALEDHFRALHVPGTRQALELERLDRGCTAKRDYPSSPLIPGSNTCP